MHGSGNVSLKVSFSILGLLCGSLLYSCNGKVDTTPAAAREGWRPELVNTPETKAVVATMPAFAIRSADGSRVVQDNARANVRLWKWTKLVNGGLHLPNVAQEVGDCVSHGAANAINATAAVQIGRDGRPQEFRRAFPPYLYGTSRVLVGRNQLRGDGSVGAWAAKAAQEYGVLPVDWSNVPTYSGTVARQWGNPPGPPEEFLTAARPFKVETVAKMKSADDVRDAVCNGYGVSIASDAGFLMSPPLVDGRRINRRSGSWNHQMSIVGYDGETWKEPLWYVLNSWGANAHGEPGGDEPPGGFWVKRGDVEYIVRQGDSFAFSGFNGFPAQSLDFRIMGKKPGLPPPSPVELPADVDAAPLKFDVIPKPKKTAAILRRFRFKLPA